MITVLVYLVVMCAWVYALLNRIDAAADEPWLLVTYGVLAVLHVAVGILVGRWWAVLLPIAVVGLSVPAGYVPDGRPEFPIWFGLAWLSPVMAVLLGLGVASRKLVARRAATA